MSAILIFNYTEAEQKVWQFLMRGFPGIQLIPVARNRFGLTMDQLLEGETSFSPSAAFDQRMAVFCEMPGPILSLLIDISKQVTKQKAYKAVLTDSNRGWSASTLLSHLMEEEAEILKAQQK